jgi:hypothetical protein
MIYDTSLYEKRKINHLKILVMCCSCGQIFFLQRKNDKHFTIRYKKAFLRHVRMLFFMRKYEFHIFFWVFSSTDWSRILILLKIWETLLFTSNLAINKDENINKITNKLRKSILIVHYAGESSNLSFTLFTQKRVYYCGGSSIIGRFCNASKALLLVLCHVTNAE